LALLDHIVMRVESHIQSCESGLFSIDEALELALDVSLAFWTLFPVGKQFEGDALDELEADLS